jgi:hypothetical protein
VVVYYQSVTTASRGSPYPGMQSAAQLHQIAFVDREILAAERVGALDRLRDGTTVWVWTGQGNLAASETLTWGDPFTRTLGATGSNQSQGDSW